MQPLFGSETDGIQERKLVKRLLRKKKITFILTALCALIYLLQNIGFEEPIMDLFHYPAYSWEDQEVWRYFTHAIVHLSVPHILFNLSWFWLFGGAIERRFGSLHFLLLVLVSAAEWRCTELFYRSRLFRAIWCGLCRVRLCVGGGQIAPA